MTAFAGPDALKIESAPVEVQHLCAVGTIPGVLPLLAAGRNGAGVGYLKSAGDGQDLHWKAPGSVTYGAAVLCSVDGTYLLRDGEDADRWLRVQVDVSELSSGHRESTVALATVFNNAIASDDVTEAEATAGDVETYTLTLENQSNTILSQLKIWIDAAVSGIEISDDGAAWVSPTTAAAALVLPDLAVGATDTLHVRRTITAAASADGDIETLLHFSHRG